jgi:polyisoprenoid-binding protein YceI
VRGRFREFSGTINIAEVPEQSSAEATIQAASIDTGDRDRDAHLRSPEFLDVERYPVIVYRSTSLQAADADQWEVKGDPTIRDRTRPVTMPAFRGSVGSRDHPLINAPVSMTASRRAAHPSIA